MDASELEMIALTTASDATEMAAVAEVSGAAEMGAGTETEVPIEAMMFSAFAVGTTEEGFFEIAPFNENPDVDPSLMFAGMMQDSPVDDSMNIEGVALLEDIGTSIEVRSMSFEATSETSSETDSLDFIAFNVANQVPQLDVDGNGRISPLDAWLIISSINDYQREIGIVANAQRAGSDNAFDLNRDSYVSHLDVLIVINQINRMEDLNWFMVEAPNTLEVAGIRIGDVEQLDEGMDLSEFAGSRMMAPSAFSKVVTGTSPTGEGVVVSINEDGKVSAMIHASEAPVSVGDDGLIRIDNEHTGLGIVGTEGDYGIALLSAEPTDWTFVWTSDLDAEFAQLA
jgi:Dockerin type I domain